MEIRENISLKDYTTFEIGGPARYFVTVSNEKDLTDALRFAQEKKIPFYVLGGGSNIVFSDQGYGGMVIAVGIKKLQIKRDTAHIGAGENLLYVIRELVRHGCTGLEKMAGIPGSVGGAVRGNAGAFGSEIGDFVTQVSCTDRETGAKRQFTQNECIFKYRDSIFKQNDRYIITDVMLHLQKGDTEAAAQTIDETIALRESKHIQDIRSAGSFFINPIVGDDVQRDFEKDKGAASREGRVPAGWLLERAGMDRERIGDIQAGEMHANYFINLGDGTAEQVIQLASMAKMRVRDQYNIQLKEEVQLVGF